MDLSPILSPILLKVNCQVKIKAIPKNVCFVSSSKEKILSFLKDELKNDPVSAYCNQHMELEIISLYQQKWYCLTKIDLDSWIEILNEGKWKPISSKITNFSQEGREGREGREKYSYKENSYNARFSTTQIIDNFVDSFHPYGESYENKTISYCNRESRESRESRIELEVEKRIEM